MPDGAGDGPTAAFWVAVGLTLAFLAALGSELVLAYRTPPRLQRIGTSRPTAHW